MALIFVCVCVDGGGVFSSVVEKRKHYDGKRKLKLGRGSECMCVGL